MKILIFVDVCPSLQSVQHANEVGVVKLQTLCFVCVTEERK